MSIPRPRNHKPVRPRPKFNSLAALISALDEGVMSRKEVEDALAAVQQGIGLNKRDRALGEALEQTGEEQDGPSYWNGFRDGLVQGYTGAQTELEQGRQLRPIQELIDEAQAEAAAEASKN